MFRRAANMVAGKKIARFGRWPPHRGRNRGDPIRRSFHLGDDRFAVGLGASQGLHPDPRLLRPAKLAESSPPAIARP
jgi:hypothetical protein